MPDLPVLASGGLVLVLAGVTLGAALLDAPREAAVLASAALVGVGAFLVRRGLAPLPWESQMAERRAARRRR